jgi:hypothetical protein
MEINSSVYYENVSLEEKLNRCLDILKDEKGFDLTFLLGVKPWINFISPGQSRGILRVYNRWNIEHRWIQKQMKIKAE